MDMYRHDLGQQDYQMSRVFMETYVCGYPTINALSYTSVCWPSLNVSSCDPLLTSTSYWYCQDLCVINVHI